MNVSKLIDKCRQIDANEEQQHLKRIRSNGYTIVEEALSNQLVNQLLLMVRQQFDHQKKDPLSQVPAEWEADWILNLQNKDKEFIDLLDLPIARALMIRLLNDPHFRPFPATDPNYILGQFVARSSLEELELHIDAGMPQPGHDTTMIQMSFVLEDTNSENGCTHVVPGSHLLGEYSDRSYQNPMPVPGRAGDLLIWDARLWHGSKKNNTDNTRWCIIATFQRWWIKQSFDMPRALPENIYVKLTDKQKALIGYCTIPPLDEKERRTRAIKYSDLSESAEGLWTKS